MSSCVHESDLTCAHRKVWKPGVTLQLKFWDRAPPLSLKLAILAILACQGALRMWLSLPPLSQPSTGVKVYAAMTGFHMGVGDLSSGLMLTQQAPPYWAITIGPYLALSCSCPFSCLSPLSHLLFYILPGDGHSKKTLCEWQSLCLGLLRFWNCEKMGFFSL